MVSVLHWIVVRAYVLNEWASERASSVDIQTTAYTVSYTHLAPSGWHYNYIQREIHISSLETVVACCRLSERESERETTYNTLEIQEKLVPPCAHVLKHKILFFFSHFFIPKSVWTHTYVAHTHTLTAEPVYTFCWHHNKQKKSKKTTKRWKRTTSVCM